MNIFQRTYKMVRDSFTGTRLAIGTDADNTTSTLDVDGDLRVRTINDGSGETSIAVVNADGEIYTRSLGTMFPENMFLFDASYNETTNFLTLTMNNGSTFNVDLNDLVDIGNVTKLIDSDGDTSVEVEKTADEDIVWVTVKNGSVMKFEATGSSMLKNASMTKGYAATKANVTTDTYTIVESDHLIHVTNTTGTETTLTLPVAANLPDGKIYEIKSDGNVLDVVIGSDVNFDNGTTTLNLKHSKDEKYTRLILDKANSLWVVVEEMERDGVVYDGVPAIGANTITNAAFIGVTTSQVSFYRDGVMESYGDFSIANGVLTLLSGGVFQGEDCQLRRI